MKLLQPNNANNFLSLLLFLLPATLLLVDSTDAAAEYGGSLVEPSPKHFVLVHGASHGAWCWYKLIPLITASGHNVTALDMTSSGINPVQIEQVTDSISDYFQPLTDFMTSVPPGQKVILVGHSFGGLGIAKAMEMFPEKISVAVFIAAAMIGPKLDAFTLGIQTLIHSAPMEDNYFIFRHGSITDIRIPIAVALGPIHMAKYLYQKSPAHDVALATTLVRPLHLYNPIGMSKELVLTEEKYGRVSRVFIIPDEDNNGGKEYLEWIVDHNPPNETLEIEGADHMAMISKPLELTGCLLDIAQRYSPRVDNY